jgi:hypothetical protein
MTDRARRVVVASVVAFAVSAAVVACGGPTANEGDCSARIRYAGTIYRPHNALNQDAATAGPVGRARVIDCDGSPLRDLEAQPVSGLTGVPVAIAVRVTGSPYGGVYVAVGVHRAQWPAPLRRS